MRRLDKLFIGLVVMTMSCSAGAVEVERLSIGDVEIRYDYESLETGTAILTVNAIVSETNNRLRGLKNTDRRRLGKLGQLIYQCKLMLLKPGNGQRSAEPTDPVLVAKNYSLFTGVDLPLAMDERVGIRAQLLQSVDADSLFTPSLGGKQAQRDIWETFGDGAAINLKQFDVGVLRQSGLIENSESIDLIVRFPVFQLEKPVSQWIYNFDLRDFKRAQRHIDENCNPVRFVELIGRGG